MLRILKKGKILQLALLFILITGVAMIKKPINIPVHPVLLVIQTKEDIFSYKVELAFTASQSAAGLMYRTNFPRDRAMLFRNQVNDNLRDEREMLMWMANTPLPLDMIFLNAEGLIVSIVENTSPFSKDIISSKVPAAFVIEVNAGEVSEKKIKRGQRVLHPVICGECESNKNDS
ncbi:DUF192 domain-containing protein [Bartonella sp. CB175]|uniref:DUF192 domain-containing protein n=1 Tax=Bartonella sp. CB175 TaxID=3112256 RepID=UPI00300E477D